MRTFNPISRADTAPVISPNAAKVLRNTYMLLGITLLPTILGAFVGVQFNPLALMGLWSLLLFIPVMLGFQAMIIRNRHSVAGVWWLLGFTFAMGWMLVGPSVGIALGSFRNGAELVGMAVGGTAAIFFVLAGYATVTKRNFTGVGLGKTVFIGMMMAFILSIINAVFLQMPAIALAISAVFMVIASAFIVITVNRIVRGGEDNYILATMTLYIMLLNLFQSLLHLLMAFAGNRD